MAATLRVLPTRWLLDVGVECNAPLDTIEVISEAGHKMAACEFCLQDGGVSESFTHNMATLKFCLQNGGVSKSFTHKMAAWENCLQDGGNAKQAKRKKNNVEYALRLQCRI